MFHFHHYLALTLRRSNTEVAMDMKDFMVLIVLDSVCVKREQNKLWLSIVCRVRVLVCNIILNHKLRAGRGWLLVN